MRKRTNKNLNQGSNIYLNYWVTYDGMSYMRTELSLQEQNKICSSASSSVFPGSVIPLSARRP